MPKNYYLILGISADSSLRDIKAAYRRLAKEFHPDYFGEQQSPFPSIQEAYAVLSDPERRRRYDESLDTVRRTSVPRHGRPSGEMVEPLIPRSPGAERRARFPRSLRPEPLSIFDLFFDRVSEDWRRDRREENMEVTVGLTEEQAQGGGHVRLRLPAQMRCPECRGRGHVGFYECRRCFCAGFLQGEIPLLLSYPANVRDNHTVRLSLDRHGFPGMHLIIRFAVTGTALSSVTAFPG